MLFYYVIKSIKCQQLPLKTTKLSNRTSITLTEQYCICREKNNKLFGLNHTRRHQPRDFYNLFFFKLKVGLTLPSSCAIESLQGRSRQCLLYYMLNNQTIKLYKLIPLFQTFLNCSILTIECIDQSNIHHCFKLFSIVPY